MREFKMYGIVGTSVKTGKTLYYDTDCTFVTGILSDGTELRPYLVRPYLTTELSSAKSAKTRSAIRYEGYVKDVRIVEVDLTYNL